MNKIRIGIVFGGFSKEREISFAGGRTVYDNLNKSIFEPIPVFVDSFGNFVLLNWEFVYKGSIRDFYPPVEFLPPSSGEFQVYAESLGYLSYDEQEKLINRIGKRILPADLKLLFDFAFLCLHGPYGEDGKIQGLLEYLGIPYSGSGILPSAIGMDKALQKRLMVNAGFNSPKFMTVKRDDFISGKVKGLFAKAKKAVGLPMVIKPANQGSSIGVTIMNEKNEQQFLGAVGKALFTHWIAAPEWKKMDAGSKTEYVRSVADIREGIGLPVSIMDSKWKHCGIVHHPGKLIETLDNIFRAENKSVMLESLDGESEVLIEGFIEGKEFSCIVIQDENGNPIALPPTEIRKGKELFDYRSKYLPGLSRKITPIDLPQAQIRKIMKECERLFVTLGFDVYARIDGFINKKGKIFLNDPNTTSGMMPSSFFFHQAAEIGLNPSQFLTYIIRTSLNQRILAAKNNRKYDHLLGSLDKLIEQNQKDTAEKIKVAVILGGYSSERHISVESGRNVYEKLSSSSKYRPVPIFLSGSAGRHELWHIPVKILLKDNADDIKEKTGHYKVHPVVSGIIKRSSAITKKYSTPVVEPRKISYQELAGMADVAFIALHGRPGEDGAVQAELEKIGMPYNGSGVESSRITIDKYETNELLKKNGFLVAEHMLITEDEWHSARGKAVERIRSKIKIPLIAKPVDDGCSSAVRKIKTVEELEAFAKLIFRKKEELDPQASQLLNIRPKEEFPVKKVFLAEELIAKKGARHFLEITGGMVTKFNPQGQLEYEVFEASEALSEGEVLSLEEKFLAGQGQNITPARYSPDPHERQKISDQVKATLERAARLLNVRGYCRIDAFVRVHEGARAEVVFIEVNSLPGMTPATCIFHQAAIDHYKPYEFIDKILEFAIRSSKQKKQIPQVA